MVAVVDLYGGRTIYPAATPPPTPGGPIGGDNSIKTLRTKQCTLHYVDPQLYQSRPGLIVHQASWHPCSDSHLACLTSDSRWRLYSLEDLSLAEQTFDLRAAATVPLNQATSGTPPASSSSTRSPSQPATAAAGGSGRFGLLGSGQPGALREMTAFAFGPPVSWGFFTIFFLSSAGAVFALCPVCPFGMRVPSSVLRHTLLSGSEPGPVTAWLKSAFGVEALSEGFSSKQRWVSQHHVQEGCSPCLQGPLNAAQASLLPHPASPAVALHISYLLEHHATSTPSSSSSSAAPVDRPPAQTCTSALVVGLADGRLYAHIGHGLLGPCWEEAPPQCVLDLRGEGGGKRERKRAFLRPPSVTSCIPETSCLSLTISSFLHLSLSLSVKHSLSRARSSPSLSLPLSLGRRRQGGSV